MFNLTSLQLALPSIHMETVQRIIQSPVETIKSFTMAPSNDTSFGAHVQGHFTSYESDRQASSKEVTYATA